MSPALATLDYLRRCLLGEDEPADCDRAIAEGWWDGRRVPGTEHQYEGEPLCDAAARQIDRLTRSR